MYYWWFLFSRSVMSSSRQIREFPSPAELALSLSQLLVHESRGKSNFSLGLSGGSLVQLLSRELPKTAGLNTEGWKVAMCDERLVPFTDPESTYGEYLVCSWLGRDFANVFTIASSVVTAVNMKFEC